MQGVERDRERERETDVRDNRHITFETCLRYSSCRWLKIQACSAQPLIEAFVKQLPPPPPMAADVFSRPSFPMYPPPPPPLPRNPGAAYQEVMATEGGKLALDSPLPTVGVLCDGSSVDWMEKFYCTFPCWGGKSCRRAFCPYYHSEAERRCAKHVEGQCKDVSDHPHLKGCDAGLHVWPCDVKEIRSVDLECGEDVRAFMEYLKRTPLNETAKVVRLVVYGYAGVRSKALERMCSSFPLLHEIVLPDREKEYNLLVLLSDLIEKLPLSNPRLQYIIFQGAERVAVWETT